MTFRSNNRENNDARRRKEATRRAVVVLGFVFVTAVAASAAAATGSNLLTNPGVESGSSGRSLSGAAYTQTSNPHSGSQNLVEWSSSSSWSAQAVQTMTGLTQDTNWGTSAAIDSWDCGDITQNVAISMTTAWTQVDLIVSVLSSSCSVGTYSSGNASTSFVADDSSFIQQAPRIRWCHARRR